ncbi:arylsulfatase [Echinicola strongylocentroti]|uniref:Arylsulfatase n=1 Tax=Echinicola strongylocentroti TaxID=1795355 RepID=A0A2Z4IQ01_9BACT|nr:arylsulfatase [Echinicola strongylocentroti]AWW32718.1 arylsulfatase [Echinicola strongylocentroti]
MRIIPRKYPIGLAARVKCSLNDVIVALLSLVIVSCGQVHETENGALPNIILINVDDLGYGDLSCYGATKVNTPHIDRLASEGMKFTDAHSASAVCTPSRYAILTGKYPFKEGLWGPLRLNQKLIVDTTQITIARLLKNKAYQTAYFGKWHLGFGNETPTDWNAPLVPGPLQLGFDYYYGIPFVNSGPPYVFVENDRVVGLDADDPIVFGGKPASKTPVYPHKRENLFAGGAKAHALYKDNEMGKVLAEKSVEWIRKDRDSPFFLYLIPTHIHHPFTPASKFEGSSQAGIYGDFIHELDWMVGEMVAAVEEMGMTDNTLIILTSNNGGMLSVAGQEAWKLGHHNNGELLGFKYDAWEGGHRIPLIAKWPAKIQKGVVSEALVGNLDYLATFAEIIGEDLEGEAAKDSFSFLSSLLGSEDRQVRKELVLAPRHESHLALRQGKWLFIDAQGSGGFTSEDIGSQTLGGAAAHVFTKHINSDIEDGKYKASAPPAQLYDLDSDLSQTTNLYNQFPEIRDQMRARLNELRGQDEQ